MLLELLVPLVIFMYSAVLFSVIVLRRKFPAKKRYFKVPFGTFGPLLAIAGNLFLVAMWLHTTSHAQHLLSLGVSLMGLGIPVYFLIAMYHDPTTIQSVEDLTAHFNSWFDWIYLPPHIRGVVIQSLGDVRGKTILDYGCKSGSLTIPLAHAVGPSGKVIGVDISKNNIKIAMKRVQEAVWYSDVRTFPEVHLIHDKEQMTRIHPDINLVDMVVSVGMLGYVQKRDIVLDEMYSLLPDGGRICLIEYGDFFGIMPNIEWLSNNAEIEETFRKRGFSVRVERLRGLFWRFIVIYGVKYPEDVPFI